MFRTFCVPVHSTPDIYINTRNLCHLSRVTIVIGHCREEGGGRNGCRPARPGPATRGLRLPEKSACPSLTVGLAILARFALLPPPSSLLPRGAGGGRNRVRWRRPARERADFVSPPPRSGLAILAGFALLPPPPGRGAGGAEPGSVAAACEGARRLRVPSPTVGARHLGGLRTPPSSPGAGRGRRGTGFGGGGLRGSAPTSCPSPTVGARHPGGLRTPPSSLLPPPVQSPHTPTGAAP